MLLFTTAYSVSELELKSVLFRVGYGVGDVFSVGAGDAIDVILVCSFFTE